MRERGVSIRKVAGWEFFDSNVAECDVVRPGGLEALNHDDRAVARWCIEALRGCRRAVDLGCGSGFPGLYVAPCVGHITGVDAAPNVIAAARRNSAVLGVENALFEVGDAGRLRFRDGEFDGALLCGVLESMDWKDVARATSELRRVLRAGARVAVVDRDWPQVLLARPAREVVVRPHGDGFLVRCVARESSPGLERDVRCVIDGGSPLSGRLRSELGDRRECPVDIDVAGLASSDVIDAWYDEAAQFDESTLVDLITRAGFGHVVLDRLPVWEHGVLALTAVG